MESTERKPSTYRWVVLGTWITSHVVAFVIFSVLGILLPSITEEMGLSPAQQGLLGSSAQWGSMVLAVPLALWGSRYSPKLLTTVTLALGAALVFLQGWAPSFLLLLMARLAFGMTLTARRAAFALLTQQWFPPREFVLANGVVNAFFGATMGLGYIVTPLILGASGGSWRTTLYVFGFLSLAMVLLWLLLGRERVTSEYRQRAVSQERSPLWSILRYRQLWLCALGLLGAQLAWMAFASFWPTLMLDRYGVSLKWSGNLLGINSFAAAVAGIVVGLLVARIDVRKTVTVVAGVALAASLACMTLTGSIPLLLAADLLNGAGWCFWPILMALPFQLRGIRPREVAVALGFLDVSLWLGGAIGPLMAGLLEEATGELRLALVVTSLFVLTISIVGLLTPFGGLRSEPQGTDA